MSVKFEDDVTEYDRVRDDTGRKHCGEVLITDTPGHQTLTPEYR